jgi:hypothetical protein
MKTQALLCFLLSCFGASCATLEWDPNPEPNVIGYRVYVGTSQRLYDQVFDVGLSTTFIIDNLPGLTTFFAVSAYDSDGLESDLSEEVFYTLTNVVAIAITRAGITVSPDSTAYEFLLYSTPSLGVPFKLVDVYTARGIPVDWSKPQGFFRVIGR